ncbi:MAG: AAA family ATPase [Kiritimatiellia bacterium]
MAKFKQINHSFMFSKVTEYFGNLVSNWDEEVKDNDMFEIVANCFDHDKAVELIEAAFTHEQLEEMRNSRQRRMRLDFSDSLECIFQCIWNATRHRKACKVVLGEIVKQMLDEAANKDVQKEPVARRCRELKKLLKLSDLESELVCLAYVVRETCFEWPRRVDSREKPLFFAMALDRSYSEVAAAMSPTGRLRKFGVLDDDWDFNSRMLGNFLDGSDDEADELLRGSSGGFGLFGFDMGGKSTEKGVTNTLLDEMKMPAVWICNAPAESMDESVRRRFDYSIRFDALSAAQRVAIWTNLVEKEGLSSLIPSEKIPVYASAYETSAGGISGVLANVKRLNPDAAEIDALVASLMKPHCSLMGIRPSDRFLPAKDYSLEGLNIKGKVKPADVIAAAKNYLDAAFAEAGEDRPRFNVLLWGAPGTGKSEFCKYLSKTLDRRVLVKKGSDILSKWVGGTEANIAAAFREAKANDAILFFDEIDGLVQDRSGASQHWEVSQVNELLQQMESFDGILIAATNFCSNLDAAIMRRFTYKLEFAALDDAGKRHFFEHMFKATLTEGEFAELKDTPGLTPGDFRTVRQELYYLGKAVTNADRLAGLREECKMKKGARPCRTIGFAV